MKRTTRPLVEVQEAAGQANGSREAQGRRETALADVRGREPLEGEQSRGAEGRGYRAVDVVGGTGIPDNPLEVPVPPIPPVISSWSCRVD